MRISDWSSDVCSSDLFTDTLGLRFHDVGRKALRDLGVHPLVAAVAEKGAVDLAAGPGIAVLADQDRDRIGRIHRRNGDVAADGVGIGITELGRAHASTPATTAHLVCRLLIVTITYRALGNRLQAVDLLCVARYDLYNL